MAFGVYTGFRVALQCFQYFPCPPSPEVLKALQDNFTPYIFSSFVVGCSWRLRELRSDGRTGTGFGLSCNAFNTHRALQNLEVLKAGQGEVLKALQANIIPIRIQRFAVGVGETMIAQIGWQSRHRVTCYLSMLSTLPVPFKTFSVKSRAQDVLKAVQGNITPIRIQRFAVAVGD
jgi:hypothetical protein